MKNYKEINKQINKECNEHNRKLKKRRSRDQKEKLRDSIDRGVFKMFKKESHCIGTFTSVPWQKGQYEKIYQSKKQ